MGRTYVDNNYLQRESLEGIAEPVVTPSVKREYEFGDYATLSPEIRVRSLSDINGRYDFYLWEVANNLYRTINFDGISRSVGNPIFDELDSIPKKDLSFIDWITTLPFSFQSSISLLSGQVGRYKFTETNVERGLTDLFDKSCSLFRPLFNLDLTFSNKKTKNERTKKYNSQPDESFFENSSGKDRRWTKNQLKKGRKNNMINEDGSYNPLKFYNHNDTDVITTAIIDAALTGDDINILAHDFDFLRLGRGINGYLGEGSTINISGDKGEVDISVGSLEDIAEGCENFLRKVPKNKISRRVMKTVPYDIPPNTAPSIWDTVFNSVQAPVAGAGVYALSNIASHIGPELVSNFGDAPIRSSLVASLFLTIPHLATYSAKSFNVALRGLSKPPGKIDLIKYNLTNHKKSDSGKTSQNITNKER